MNIKQQRIAQITRRSRVSVNGNPSFNVVFTDGSAAQTVKDGGVAYKISNSDYQDVELRVTYEGGFITNVEVVSCPSCGNPVTGEGADTCEAWPLCGGRKVPA